MEENTSNQATLCLPLKYSYAIKPRSDETRGYTVYFESVGSGSIWRDYDISSDREHYNDSLAGRQVSDCLPDLRRALTNKEGLEKAWLNEDRVLEGALTITLKGSADTVNQERSRILQSYYTIESSDIGIDEPLVFDNSSKSDEIDSRLRLELEAIAKYCEVSISVTDFLEPKATVTANKSNKYRILTYGDQDSVRFASKKIQILLEDLAGNFVDSLPINLSLQPLVCGPMLSNLTNIQAQTGVRVYMMDWLPEVLGSHLRADEEQRITRNFDEIYIAGNLESSVIVAKTLIKEVFKRTKPVFKDCVVSFAKIDLLILRYGREVREIMQNYGTFIQLPFLGASRSLVRVQGCTSQSVEKAIGKLMSLIMEIYNANYWIHTGEKKPTKHQEQDRQQPHQHIQDVQSMMHTPSAASDDIHHQHQQEQQAILNQPHIETDLEFLDKITFASGATILCVNNTSFDITGFSSDTKRATGMIKSLPFWEEYHHQVKFRLELSIDQREFIAGKKNGKIIRIMNNSNVWIKFEPFNEYNFYITLSADDYNSATAGIRLLEDELPSETSFYIPETYHKQVIGAGGLTIQSIMRKYNVFIKFSNDYDIYPNGFSHVRPDNVLIRCPSKNSKNIPFAKQELIDTVQERGKDHCNTFIHLSRSHRRILLSERCGFIYEVESKTNTIILFPEREPQDIQENDLVEIRGLGNTSEDAARMVKALLPEDYVFKVAHSPKFEEIVHENNSEFYTKIIAPFRVALSIETQVFPRPSPAFTSEASVAAAEEQERDRYHRIILSFSQEHSVGLEDVIQALTTFLRDKGLDIVDRAEIKSDPVEPGTAAVHGHNNPNNSPGKRHQKLHKPHSSSGGSGSTPFDNNGQHFVPPVPAPRYPSPPITREENERYSRFYRGNNDEYPMQYPPPGPPPPHHRHHHSMSASPVPQYAIPPPPPRSPRSPSRNRYNNPRPVTPAEYYNGRSRSTDYGRYDWRDDERFRRYGYNEYRERYY